MSDSIGDADNAGLENAGPLHFGRCRIFQSCIISCPIRL